jgi:hypothetical protein
MGRLTHFRTILSWLEEKRADNNQVRRESPDLHQYDNTTLDAPINII